ncbi:TcfC E-set like domain-containing protein [Sphingomicrobium astaxanthinifaciens]|uniref:TcfC E-set like domain-containing protein n=1 Tax=Sphingomicrobium astaxanthinifaciens TaxID=1227949 RepID=UPI001FCAC8A6|nr:TcfC E-set like domain-containing protein [Sphingomicrobium astaxanthinifaciens]MCJ7420394.1 CS1-pili formation C-terminal domain-containing protein [Sphingomicrobium astaxanthinifaciens]
MSLPVRSAGLIGLSILIPNQAQAIQPTQVPPGFEELDAPRVVVLDIYYRGRPLGAVAVYIEGSRIRFEDPDTVKSLLPMVQEEFRSELHGWFESNFDKVCSRLSDDRCGFVSTDSIAFIVDEGKFRLDTFVAENALIQSQEDPFLMPSHEKASVTAILDGSVAGNDGDLDYYFQTDLVSSFGDVRATAVAGVSSTDDFVLQEAFFEGDHKGLRSQAGVFWSPTITPVGRRRILGVGTQTQWDTRVDRETRFGSILDVSLSERSRVDVFESGRLLWTGFLDVGNSKIDTRNFPQGAYTLVLTITGASGQVREEQRFFVKDRDLPPVGRNSFHIFAGLPTDNLKGVGQLDTPILTASLINRPLNSLAGGASFLIADGTALGEISAYYISDAFRVNGTMMRGARGETGSSLRVNFKPTKRISVDLSARRNDLGEGVLPLSIADLVPLVPGEERQRQRLQGNFTQLNFNLGAAVGKGALRLHGSAYSSPSTEKSVVYGATFDYPIYAGRTGSLRLSTSLLEANRTMSAYVGIRFIGSFGRTSLSASGGHRFVHSRNGASSFEETGGFLGDIALDHMRQVGSGDLRGTLGLTKEAYGFDSRAEFEFIGEEFAAQGGILQNLSGNSGQTQYSASFRSALGLADKAVLFAGSSFATAAVSIDVNAPDDAEFEIYLDGQSFGILKPGRPLSAFLEPYREYQISLRPRGGRQIHLSETEKKVTLFPGGVVTLEFEGAELTTVFGRLLSADGEVLKDQVIRSGDNISVSDAQGYFQIDVVGRNNLLVGPEASVSCPLPPTMDTQFSFRNVGDLVCE